MTRSIQLISLAVLAAFALALSGCGGDDSDSPLDNALGYLPESAPLVLTSKTNPDDAQIKAGFEIIGDTPLGAPLQEQLEGVLSGDVTFEDDIAPILGNDVVIGAQNAAAIDNDDYLAALQVKDKDKAEELVRTDSERDGEAEGVEVYRDDDTYAAVHDDVLLLSNSKQNIGAAIKQRDADDRFREEKLDDALETLPEDAVASAYFAVRPFLEQSDDDDADQALKVKWVAALESVGLSASISNDKVEVGLNVKTDPSGLTQADVPIASGAQSPAVLRREGGSPSISVSLRDPAASIQFAQTAGKQASPGGYAEFQSALDQIKRGADIDVERDVFGQFTGDTSASIDLDGKFALRSQVTDAAGLKAAFDKFGRTVARAGRPGARQFRAPKKGDDLFTFTTDDGDRFAFGVVDNLFVAGNDADKVAEVAAQPTTQVSGARGAFAANADAKAIAGELVAQALGANLGGFGGQAAAQFTGPLGELNGSLEGDTSGVRGKFSLDLE